MGLNDKKRFIHHRNLLIRGHGELSLVISGIQQGMLIWLILRDMFPPSIMKRSYIVPVVMICIVLISLIKWIWGWLFDKYKLVDQDMSWIMTRTPEMQELDSKLTEILERMDETNHKQD